MEKVRLVFDELQVQSFTTAESEAEQRGTVCAHDAPTDPVECPTRDPAWDTCRDTCAGSCGDCTGDCYSAWGWWSSLCW